MLKFFNVTQDIVRSRLDTFRRKFPNLGIILVAALLLELISAVQYWYTRGLLAQELEHHAESELRLKAVIVKGILNAIETSLRDHAYDARHHLGDHESLYPVAGRLVRAHPNIMSGGIAFKPYYYSTEERLYEPFALCRGDSISFMQLADADHDYTQMEFYVQALAQGDVYWSAPYIDEKGGLGLITTVSMPLDDADGQTVAVLGADVSLNWLGDTLNNRHMYPSSFDILLTESGRLIAGPHEKGTDVNTVVALINDSTKARQLSQTGRTTVLDMDDAKNGDATIFYANMKGEPHWQIAVVYYDHEVYGKLNRMRWNILLLSLLGLLLLGYIIYRSAGSFRRLKQADMEKERINGELRIARNIQKDMLPEHFPPFPERHDLDLYGMLEPAKEVGGDLFDFLVRDEKLFFCIGDVSGKGVPSALVMAVTHAFFRSASAHETNPARIMKALNGASCAGNESNMFVTLFVGVLDLPTGRLKYCNAGHDRPFVLEGGSARELPVKANIPVGLFDDFVYQAQEEMLTSGAMLFLYTDGLTEARDPQRAFFGEKRLKDILDNYATMKLTAEQLLKNMNDCVRQFVSGAEQSDDLTMLAVRYTPKKEDTLLHESITLKNDVSEITALSRFVKAFTESIGMKKSEASNLRLAIEEAVVNVITYAYPRETEGTVTVEADVRTSTEEDQCLYIRIMDNGVPFDPTEAAEVDTSLSAEERPIGGLGIHLMRELMDSLNYEREDGLNILTLKKKLKDNPIKFNNNENNNP